MNIEDVLCAGRIKILKTLAHTGGLSANEVRKQTGLSHATILQHFKILENAGLVQKKFFGKQRLYMMAENVKAKKVQEFFLRWDDVLW